MKTNRFRFSDEYVKRHKRSAVLMGGVLAFVPLVYALICDPDIVSTSTTGILTLFVVFGVLSVGSFAIITSLAAKRWKEVEVRVQEDGIERRAGELVDKLNYESIEKVVVGISHSERVFFVRVYSTTSAMYLHGLDRMDKLARLIERRVPERAILEEKSLIVDWSKPGTTLLVAAPVVSLCANMSDTTLLDNLG
jgi:hypothetical protein